MRKTGWREVKSLTSLEVLTPRPLRAGTAVTMPERRRHERIVIEGARATLRPLGFFARLFGRPETDCLVVDLAEGGMQVRTRKKYATGTRLGIRIELPKYQDVIEAAGEVRWNLERPEGSGKFTLGILFHALRESDTKKIGIMRQWFGSEEYRARAVKRVSASGTTVLKNLLRQEGRG